MATGWVIGSVCSRWPPRMCCRGFCVTSTLDGGQRSPQAVCRRSASGRCGACCSVLILRAAARPPPGGCCRDDRPSMRGRCQTAGFTRRRCRHGRAGRRGVATREQSRPRPAESHGTHEKTLCDDAEACRLGFWRRCCRRGPAARPKGCCDMHMILPSACHDTKVFAFELDNQAEVNMASGLWCWT